MASSYALPFLILLCIVPWVPLVWILGSRRRVRAAKRQQAQKYRSFFEGLDDYVAEPEPSSLTWIPVREFGHGAMIDEAEDAFTRLVDGVRVRVAEVQICSFRRSGNDSRTKVLHFRGWVAQFQARAVEPGQEFKMLTRPSAADRARVIIPILIATLVLLGLSFGFPMLWYSDFELRSWLPLILTFGIVGPAALLLFWAKLGKLRRAGEMDRRRGRLAREIGSETVRRFAKQELLACSDPRMGVRCLRLLERLRQVSDLPNAKLGMLIDGPKVLLLIATESDLFYASEVERLRDDLARMDRMLDLAIRELC